MHIITPITVRTVQSELETLVATPAGERYRAMVADAMTHYAALYARHPELTLGEVTRWHLRKSTAPRVQRELEAVLAAASDESREIGDRIHDWLDFLRCDIEWSERQIHWRAYIEPTAASYRIETCDYGTHSRGPSLYVGADGGGAGGSDRLLKKLARLLTDEQEQRRQRRDQDDGREDSGGAAL